MSEPASVRLTGPRELIHLVRESLIGVQAPAWTAGACSVVDRRVGARLDDPATVGRHAASLAPELAAARQVMTELGRWQDAFA